MALITGGGGGLGRLLAIRLTRLGARVVLWDINQDGNITMEFDQIVTLFSSSYVKMWVIDCNDFFSYLITTTIGLFMLLLKQ